MKQIVLLLLCILFCLISFSQTWQWTKPEQGGGNPGERTATDTQGNLYVLGYYFGGLYLNGIKRADSSGSYVAKFDSSGTLIWYDLIKSSLDDIYTAEAAANDMVVNANGVFITGYLYTGPFYNTYSYSIGSSSYLLLDGSTNNFFVSKIDFNGNVVWNKTSEYCGNGLFDNALSIGTDKQNNIIIGGLRNKAGLANYPGNDSFYIDNNLIVNSYDLTDKHNSDYDIFVLKFDFDGTLKWSNFINPLKNGNGSAPNIKSITSDNNSNVWLWTENFDSTYFGNTLFKTPHNYYSVETLSKLNGITGAFIFTKELSTNSSQSGYDGYSKQHLLTCDNSNNIYALVSMGTLAGGYQAYLNRNIPITSTGQNIYTLKYDNNAKLIWYKLIGHDQNSSNNPDDHGYEVNFYNNKLYYAGALRSESYYNGSTYFNFSGLTVPDLYLKNQFINGALKQFIAKSDTAGNFEWVTTVGGGSNAEAYSIAAFGDNVYTGGYYRYKIILGNLSGYQNSNDGYENLFYGLIKDRYIRVGAISPKEVIPGCNITIPFTSHGLLFSNSNIFTAELSDANGNFTLPYKIGTVTSTGTGTINAIIPKSLAFGTSGYKIRIKSSDTLLTGDNYYAYADTGYAISIACSPAPGGLSATSITSTSAQLNWNIVPCAVGYQIQYKVNGTSAWTTVQVKNNTTNISGLSANTTYQWHIATKCKANGTITYSSYSKNKKFTTPGSFSAAIANGSLPALENVDAIVYPNPAKDHAILQINGFTNKVSITLSDVNGKKLWKTETINQQQVNIPLNRLAAGVYIIFANDNIHQKVLKLVKE